MRIKVNNKFEFGRLRERKLSRAGAMQYLVYVIRTTPI